MASPLPVTRVPRTSYQCLGFQKLARSYQSAAATPELPPLLRRQRRYLWAGLRGALRRQHVPDAYWTQGQCKAGVPILFLGSLEVDYHRVTTVACPYQLGA